MKPDGAHTHGSGGGGSAVLVIAAALVTAAVAGPVAAAVAELVRVLLIALAVVAGTAVLGAAGLVAWRLRQGRPSAPPALTVTARRVQRPSQALPANQPPAISRPAELHLHFHGLDAGQAAAIVRQARPAHGTSDEHPAAIEDD